MEGDARDFDLDRTFDVVFAGELIEHLDDVRGFLASVRRHLGPVGRLVLTTPNAFYVGNFVYRFGGHGQVHPEHTCWYCEDTLRQVLAANGYTEIEIRFTGHTSPTPLRKMATFSAQHLLPPRLALRHPHRPGPPGLSRRPLRTGPAASRRRRRPGGWPGPRPARAGS